MYKSLFLIFFSNIILTSSPYAMDTDKDYSPYNMATQPQLSKQHLISPDNNEKQPANLPSSKHIIDPWDSWSWEEDSSSSDSQGNKQT